MAAAIDTALIIDENDGQILFWEMLLSEINLKVVKARAGAEALEKIEKENIPFAVVAWELSSMPGTLLVQKARESRKKRRMPFVIYTSRMSESDAELLRELGLESIVTLPLEKAKIKSLVTEILDRENNISSLELKLRRMEDFLTDHKPTEVLKLIGPDVSKKGPHRPRYKVIVGETFLQIGNIAKAMKAVDEALESDPHYLPAHYLKGRLLSLSGRHDEAIALLKQTSGKRPQNIESLVNLGSVYVAADRIDEAKAIVASVETMDAENESIKDTKGKIALSEGNLSLAAQLLSQTQNGDDIARFYNSLGISLVKKNEFEKGIETYQSAITLLSNKARIHLLLFNLAMAYRKKGDTYSEVVHFSKSYLSEPRFEKAYACIARGVQEAKSKGIKLDSGLLTEVVKTRADFLKDNPEMAQKIQEKNLSK